MKFLLRNKVHMVALLALLGLLMLKCAKEKQEPQLSGDGSKLIVNVTGINEQASPSTAQGKASSRNDQSAKKSGILAKDIHHYQNFDALISIKQTEESSSGSKIKSSSKSGSQNALISKAMEEGVKYRLLLYTKQGSFVSSHLLTSGIAAEIDINQSEDYVWYALSYNNTVNVPDVDPANPVLSLPANEDVLYANGEILLSSAAQKDNIPLSIVFDHSFARIVIELNSMGMFADMISANVELAGATMQTGTMDLRTGVISELTDVSQTIDFSSFKDVQPPYADRKSVYLYTAAETVLEDLTVTLKGLELALDDGSTRSFTNLLDTPSVFTFELAPILGSSHTAQINLIESTLNRFYVGWARQNLYYHGGHNPYRFHHTAKHTNERNTYFSYRGLIPGQYGRVMEDDPCLLVYPEGLWKTPGFNEFSMLTPVFPTETFGEENGLGYIEYVDATSGPEEPYGGNTLRFMMNGTGTNNGISNGVIDIDLGTTYGKSAELWTTSDEFDYNDNKITGLYYYRGAEGFGDHVNKQVVNVEAPGLQDLESDFKNIRCMREVRY